jgi:hypothetical protein
MTKAKAARAHTVDSVWHNTLVTRHRHSLKRWLKEGDKITGRAAGRLEVDVHDAPIPDVAIVRNLPCMHHRPGQHSSTGGRQAIYCFHGETPRRFAPEALNVNPQSSSQETNIGGNTLFKKVLDVPSSHVQRKVTNVDAGHVFLLVCCPGCV